MAEQPTPTTDTLTDIYDRIRRVKIRRPRWSR